MNAWRPQFFEAQGKGEGAFFACEACRSVLGEPDPDQLKSLDAQVTAARRRPIR